MVPFYGHHCHFHHHLALLSNAYLDEVISELHIEPTLRSYVSRPFAKIAPINQGYTMIIDTDTHIKSTLMLKTIPHQTFITAAANFWLSDRRPKPGYKRPLHIAKRQYDLACVAASQPIQAINHTAATTQLPTHRRLANTCLPKGPCYIGFAPGAGHPTRPKKWPLERFISVAKQQTQQGRVPVFFLGPSEASLQAQITQQLPSALFPETHPCVKEHKGPCLVIALAHQLQLAVCNDNGIAHMLATANTPIIALFGPTNADKFAPLSTHSKIIRAQQWGTNLMESIPVNAVNEAIEAMLSSQTTDRCKTPI